MNVGIIIGTFGDARWFTLGWNLMERTKRQFHDSPWVCDVIHVDVATLASARNRGAELVSPDADWLCFLDADDELDDHYFDCMAVALAAHTGSVAQIGLSPVCLVPNVAYVYDDHEDPPVCLWQRRPLIEINHAVIGTLVPRKLFMDVGGFHEEPVYEDWALWLRCERAGAVFVRAPGAVYRARVNLDSRNRQHEHILRETYFAIQRKEQAARAQRGQGAVQ